MPNLTTFKSRLKAHILLHICFYRDQCTYNVICSTSAWLMRYTNKLRYIHTLNVTLCSKMGPVDRTVVLNILNTKGIVIIKFVNPTLSSLCVWRKWVKRYSNICFSFIICTTFYDTFYNHLRWYWTRLFVYCNSFINFCTRSAIRVIIHYHRL